MYRALVIRAGWVSLCLLMIAAVSFSQPAPNATPSPNSVQIVYTGKLLGYFRVPSLQSGALPEKTGGVLQRCPALSKESDSPAAMAFMEQRDNEMFKNAILVGTGDNFSPRLEARLFDRSHLPFSTNQKPTEYGPGNKELYYGDGDHWVFQKDLPNFPKLEKRLERGLGTIPTDNVGCFLAAARFAAIVPGKHDFYFGAERVRELARFVAGLPKKEGEEPPQMLGANLVIKTVPVSPQTTPPDKEDNLWFKPEWPKDYPVQNLSDGQSVYPWFSYLHIKSKSTLPEALTKVFPPKQSITEDAFLKLLDEVEKSASPEEKRELDELRQFSLAALYVCHAEDDPNNIKINHTCRLKKRVRITGNVLMYDIPLNELPRGPNDSPRKDGHFATLMHAQNYGLCLIQKGQQPNCLRFSVHTPFFYFPNPVPSKFDDPEPLLSQNNSYVDPDPFVLLEESKSRPYKVAIFGVVDPNIGEQVGILNFSWLREDGKFKTILSAEDPAEALKEQLEYFNVWYERKGLGQFQGLKILLAQMSPQRARVFAARFPEFQVVVAGADDDQATAVTEASSVWTEETRRSAFVAVPFSSFDVEKQKVRISLTMIDACKGKLCPAQPEGQKASRSEGSWTLSSDTWSVTTADEPSREPPNPSVTKTAAANPPFKDLVDSRVKECSTPPRRLSNDRILDSVKWLTLCSIREHKGADVALIQKRDFFDELPDVKLNDPQQFQEVLDRIIWKGDLLTLMYVPGSALKNALEQSKKYEREDSNLLSLADEKWRSLEYLGARFDKEKKLYFINEVPLDEKKIYAIATSDYIGAGDTGYPDLAAAALDPKTRPSQFPDKLETISSIVCRKLFSDDKDKATRYCLENLSIDTYLDKSAAQPAPSYERPGLGSKLWNLFPFKWPGATTKPTTTKPTTKDALEQKAQHHPIWMLSLKNFSVGFLSLSNNLTDAQLGQKFAAVSTSGVTAKKSHTITIGLGMQLSRSSHLNEFFVSMGIDYSEQSIGDVAPNISQLKNRLTGDAGLIRSIKGGRSKDRVGITFTLHAETPLQQPFTTFKLGTKDPLKITQNRSVLLLPRIGMRWQNGDNFFEVGGQVGREIQAFSGYRFNTQGSIVECLPSATQTFAACITEKSTLPMMAITKDSTATAILRNRPRAGLYWKYGLSIPFGSKVKYDINQEGNQEADFFFNFHQDNSADTRFLDRSKHSLKFTIWPSFSIGPSLQFLLYRNKVNHDFLFQKQFGFEANFSFNLFNPREKKVQIKHKP